MTEVLLALIGLTATAIGGLVWALKTHMRHTAAREIAWREFMSNEYAHRMETWNEIARYMGEQVAVLREVREDLREIREELRR